MLPSSIDSLRSQDNKLSCLCAFSRAKDGHSDRCWTKVELSWIPSSSTQSLPSELGQMTQFCDACTYSQPSLRCLTSWCYWLVELRLSPEAPGRLSLEGLYHEPPSTHSHQTQEVGETKPAEEPSDQKENVCISPPVSSTPEVILPYVHISRGHLRSSRCLSERSVLSEAASICWLIRDQSLGVFSSRWSYLYSSALLYIPIHMTKYNITIAVCTDLTKLWNSGSQVERAVNLHDGWQTE